MRILIDFTQIPLDRTGVGVYAENLIRCLVPEIAESDSLTILIQRNELSLRALIESRPNVRLELLPFSFLRNRLLLLLFEQAVLPSLLRRLRIDVVHSLHYTYPLLTRTTRVVTIHDLTFLLFPRLHTWGRRIIMPFFIRRALKQAEGLIFVSNSTRSDAEKLISPANNLRRVIPLAVDRRGPAMAISHREKMLAARGIGEPFLLFIGTIEPRKNLLRLIMAFEKAARELPPLQLVVVGKRGWQEREFFRTLYKSPFRKRIHYLGFVQEEERNLLLDSCSILIYPTLYEGFGLPVLEGMAAGAAIITSNTSSLPEVAGDTAVLINPLSTDDIAGAILRLMADPEERKRLGAAAKERSRSFNWQRVAAETIQMYRDVYERARRSGSPVAAVESEH